MAGNTIVPADAQFGGEVSLLYGQQTVDAYTAATSLLPAGFVNVPGLQRAADMDKIYPLGTYKRQQNNLVNYRPSLSFTQDLQDILLLGAALRQSDGTLNYYTFAFGNAEVARQAIGAKVSSAKIDCPRDGRLSVSYGFDCLQILPLSSPPAAMTYSAAKVLYGYSLALSTSGSDYTQFLSKMSIDIGQTLVRLMPQLVGTSPNQTLRSQGLKETIQTVDVTFDLYEPLSLQEVSEICRGSFNVEALYIDPCDATHIVRITLTDLQFSADNLQEGDMQSILQFSAAADAQNITIASA